jgi:hypothetical protein
MPDAPGSSQEIAVAAPMSAELVEQFARMAMLVPSETSDAVESIITAILNAPSWDHLDDPWESSKAEALAGVVFRIEDVTRRPSDYRDGIGIFLVVHSLNVSTGEKFVWTTSATSVVAQLVHAYVAGWLPLHAELVIAARATERGYRPHHLKFHGPGAPPRS